MCVFLYSCSSARQFPVLFLCGVFAGLELFFGGFSLQWLQGKKLRKIKMVLLTALRVWFVLRYQGVGGCTYTAMRTVENWKKRAAKRNSETSGGGLGDA
jgi:hypothetical protein